ncbi:hypothetical protein L211DRAFT_871546 [Terfezia boudieri ATCC MYA-4762]|uniref:Uncharacterized protein n=1 Tax=Terfezia boudieri ATCC MYA-4762 TaxID=1051890 RepID=A0A3N4L8J7_9PEZI|nr:hypothetical protein L211DRAFT_871546 [Terfezia boudieri ATCC MYA-4762]
MEGVNNQHRQQRIVLARQILAQLIGLMVPGYFRSLTDRTRGKNQQESVTGNDKNNEVGVWKPLDIRTKARITFSRDSAQLSKQREFDQNTTGHPNRLGRCRANNTKDPGVEPESTLVNIQVPLASISQYTSAQTQVMQRRLEELTEENERLKEELERERDGMKEEMERLEQENIGVKEEIERLEWENKAMKDKLQIISGLLNE